MKQSLRFTSLMMLLWLSTSALAQDHTDMQKSPAPKSEAQTSFDTLKNLAGTWTGPVTFDTAPPRGVKDGQPIQIVMHVTSRGNALVHEIPPMGVPDDPAHYDHPVTMLYVEDEHLTLVHYCDAGNRPRMVARKSPDGKTVEFDLVDLSGSTRYGHMQHAVFTTIDADHHTEDWTYMLPGDKPMRSHFELKRVR
jgi:hypothetical protein